MKKLFIVPLLFILFGLMAMPVVFAAPQLEFEDLEGRTVSLAQLSGKEQWLLVMFWATTCAICEAQKPLLSQFHDSHKEKDANVIGVVIDGPGAKEAIRKSLIRYPVSFPTYVADLGLLALNYEIATGEPFRGTPTYWLLDPNGKLVGVNPGPLRVEAIEKFIATH
ncbi:MAG: TlpA family protein disulfide reductase [bacterium]